MRKVFFALALLLGLAFVAPADADTGFSILIPNPAMCIGTGIDCHATPVGFQQIAVPASSTALTVPTGATFAIIQDVTAAVSWRDDGTAPTAAIGMQLAINTSMVYAGDLTKIRFIQTAAGAVLNVSYYR